MEHGPIFFLNNGSAIFYHPEVYNRNQRAAIQRFKEKIDGPPSLRPSIQELMVLHHARFLCARGVRAYNLASERPDWDLEHALLGLLADLTMLRG